METYKHKTIAFIFDLKNPENIAEIKKIIIEFFKVAENDDDFYIYNESKLCFNQGSNAVACLAQYKFKTNPSLYLLIKDALKSLNLTSSDDRRLYIISDNSTQDCKLDKIIKQVFRQNYQVLFLSLVPNTFKLSQKIEIGNLLNILLENYRQHIEESYAVIEPESTQRPSEGQIGSLTFFPFSG